MDPIVKLTSAARKRTKDGSETAFIFSRRSVQGFPRELRGQLSVAGVQLRLQAEGTTGDVANGLTEEVIVVARTGEIASRAPKGVGTNAETVGTHGQRGTALRIFGEKKLNIHTAVGECDVGAQQGVQKVGALPMQTTARGSEVVGSG